MHDSDPSHALFLHSGPFQKPRMPLFKRFLCCQIFHLAGEAHLVNSVILYDQKTELTYFDYKHKRLHLLALPALTIL